MERKKDVTSTFETAGQDLGELLVKENLITPEQLENALETQRKQGGKLFLGYQLCSGS